MRGCQVWLAGLSLEAKQNWLRVCRRSRTLGTVGPLGEIFNPGMRHEIEERRSKELRREEEGNATGGEKRIDLESGFVHIIAEGSADKSTADNSTSDESAPETDDDSTAN